MKTVYPHSFGKFVYYSFGIARMLLDCTVPMPALGSVRTHVDVGKIDIMNRQESVVPMMIPLNVCVRDDLILPRSALVKSVFKKNVFTIQTQHKRTLLFIINA